MSKLKEAITGWARTRLLKLGVRFIELGFRGTIAEPLVAAVMAPDGLLHEAATDLYSSHNALCALPQPDGTVSEIVHTLSIKQTVVPGHIEKSIEASKVYPANVPQVPYLQSMAGVERISTLGNIGLNIVSLTQSQMPDAELGQVIRQQVCKMTGQDFEYIHDKTATRH